MGVFALVGSGCAVRSRRLARVRASGLVASLRDEAVAGVVIVCPCHSTTLRFPYKCEALWRSDTPTMAAISGAKLIQRAFRGDASSRNEKSGNLASCLLAGGVLSRPLAIRYDVFPSHRGCDTPGSQKAPSTKRCIKTLCASRFPLSGACTGQKAPSAKRRIKTVCASSTLLHTGYVRKHRAPKGALRLSLIERSASFLIMSESTEHQKVH